MLISVKEMRGLTIAALDGECGAIDDFYFDDEKWTLRYMVADTGGLITGRNVLLPINLLLVINWAEETVQVNLTRQQIQDSPDIDTGNPVSRQHETELYNHYGYPYYWSGPYSFGAAIFPTIVEKEQFQDPNRVRLRERMEQEAANADSHLRSINDVTGYEIQATNDTVGHVEDFLVDDKDWSIRLIAVDTRNWWPGKKVLISPERIDHVSWLDKKVVVSVTREEVEDSPEYDPAKLPPFGPKHDLYRRFGMPHL